VTKPKIPNFVSFQVQVKYLIFIEYL